MSQFNEKERTLKAWWFFSKKMLDHTNAKLVVLVVYHEKGASLKHAYFPLKTAFLYFARIDSYQFLVDE